MGVSEGQRSVEEREEQIPGEASGSLEDKQSSVPAPSPSGPGAPSGPDPPPQLQRGS